MNRGEIFAILGIAETDDKDLIRSAYMEKLSVTNPEDNPEGFKMLRNAYDEALALAKKQEDNSPVGMWLKDVEKCYNNFDMRCDTWAWEELLEDEVCSDEGCFENARDALLEFIMENSFLPVFAFDMVKEKFKIEKDYEELCEKFPRGFIDFVLRGGNGLSLELIKAENGGEADLACSMWFDRRNAAADGKNEVVAELDEKYSQMKVFMPYYEVDRAIYLAKENKPKAEAMLKELEYCVGKDPYITAGCARAYMDMGDKENAARLCDIVEEKYPGNFTFKIVRADILVAEGKYAEAKKEYEKLYDGSNNPEIFEKLRNVNKKLMETLKAETVEDKLELGWCYYQNEMNDELMELVDSFEPESEKDVAMYYNLRSRALLAVNRNEEALICIEKWRDALEKQTFDNDKDENDRKRRMVLSAFFGARCYRVMASENKDKEQEYLEKALKYAEETTVCEEVQVVLQLLVERAVILLELKRYDDAIAIADELIERDNNAVPAYFIRQEANFEKRNAGAVIDDYKNILDLVPDLSYGVPYALTASVFWAYDRREEAFAILKRADENKVKSDYVDYNRASFMRYSAKNEDETKAALDILLAIEAKPQEERTDFNHNRTIDLYEEICFGYMDLEQWDKAEEADNKAIALDPDNVERYRIKLDIYKKSNNDAALKKCLSTLKKKYPDSPFVWYEQAKAYENTDRQKAINMYKKTIKLKETYRDSYPRLTALYQRQYLESLLYTDFKKALVYADKTVELYPYARSYLDRGILYMNAGEVENAEKDIKKAIELDDEYITAYEWLGDCLRIQERHAEALESYKEAYDMSKGNGNYYPVNDYALGCDAAKEFDKAAELLLELINDFDRYDEWKDLASVYDKAGKKDEAYKAYLQYRNNYELSESEKTSVDRDLLELSFELEGKKQDIFNMLSQTLKDYPASPEAYDNMAKYYCYYQGDKKLTYKFANKAVALARKKYNNMDRAYRKIWGRRSQYAYMLGDNLKIKMFRVNSPYNAVVSNITPLIERAYKNRRYRKLELYDIAIDAYFEGDKALAHKCFKQMQDGPNCVSCTYNFCVESVVGQALMHYDKGEYAEAERCMQRVLDEQFDLFIFKRIMERIKEKK